MPMYEYRCPNCGHVEEFLRKFSEDKSSEICKKCNKLMVKTINNPLWLKADGYWSRNDYENRSKHDLEEALKENDEHQRRFDKVRKEEIKSGEYMGE